MNKNSKLYLNILGYEKLTKNFLQYYAVVVTNSLRVIIHLYFIILQIGNRLLELEIPSFIFKSFSKNEKF